MANVYTRKFKRPRTTTLRDFSDWQIVGLPEPRNPRIQSPTRRPNPHPSGLVSQQPYNKDHLTFDIWNPNFAKIEARLPKMVDHLVLTNFSNGPFFPPIDAHKEVNHKYPMDTTIRPAFDSPKFPANVPHKMNYRRFGCRKYKASRGIAPNTIPPIVSEREMEELLKK